MRLFPGWWQVLVALILQAASSASVFTVYSVIAVPLQGAFEPSRMMLMMGITLAALAAGTLGIPVGAAIDRFSVRLLMLGGTALLGSGFILLSFTQSMNQVLLVYFLPLALGAVLTGPVAGSALLARWFTRRRGLAMSIAASGAAIGGLILPPLLQFLIDNFEWRLALRFYGTGIFLVTAPLVGLLVVNRPADRGLYPDGERDPPVIAGDHAATGDVSIAFFLRDRNFWFIAIILGMLLSGPMALISNLLPLVMEKSVPAVQGAVLLSCFSGANFVGKLGCGVIADRVDQRALLAAILLFLCIGMLGYLYSSAYPVLVLFTIVLGTSQGATVPLWSIMLARIYGPDNMGRSMGLMGFLVMPFTLLGSPLFGWVHDYTGSYDNALLGYVTLLFASLVFVFLIRPERSGTVAAAVSTQGGG